ncbi:MAG TPA: dUTP diphosphatase [Treponemataceae bacterium]|nr:dUTP diphosphatase [Treponemataceae bacterium]
MEVSVRCINGNIRLPEYHSDGAAGADICAYLSTPVTILPGKRTLIPTGIQVSIPVGFEIQVRPRSGLALKHGISVLNAPGTIDSDYRGEIGVLLINHGDNPFVIEDGDRIAQLVLAPVVRAFFNVSETLTSTVRGSDGYGSTGKN